jgi:hypothetical protein
MIKGSREQISIGTVIHLQSSLKIPRFLTFSSLRSFDGLGLRLFARRLEKKSVQVFEDQEILPFWRTRSRTCSGMRAGATS